MKKIFINGLFPREDQEGSKVAIFAMDEATAGKTTPLLKAEADERGCVKSEIDEKYVNKEIQVRIRLAGFKPFQINAVVKDFGFYYTARLDKDTVYSGEITKLDKYVNWNSDQHYTDALADLLDIIRKI